jgi:ABC-2 type transport system permease protein
MRKIWTIAWKDVSTTFRDRNLVLIMLAAPLAVATVIALAFGGIGEDIPIKDIPVAIVNLDKGANGQNLGDLYVNTFIPSAESGGNGIAFSACKLNESDSAANGDSSTLGSLVKAVKLEDVNAVKTAVDNGTYMAAIIIPEDFTQKVSIGVGKMTIESSSIELYANRGREIQAGIIRSIVESITNQIATGNITLQTLFASVSTKFGPVQQLTLANSPSFKDNIACAFTPGISRLTIDQQSVQGEKQSGGAIPLLIVFGSAQAMFFTLFTGQGGVNGIFEERKQGTLQRLVVTPTPRITILIGKMLGVLVNCILQLVFLFIALTIVGSILNKGFVVIWGSNYLLIGLVIVGAALASTGLGTLLAGVAKTPEQGQIYGSLINMGMAILGGAFGFQLPEIMARFSLLYWGSDAFQKLANGSTDVGLNLVVLLVMGAVMFVIGFWLFNKRLDV